MPGIPYVNKVVISGVTKIDLTSDTVTAASLRRGATAHNMSGAPITGTLDVPVVQASKSYTTNLNGSYTINPDSGKDGMAAVNLTVDTDCVTEVSSIPSTKTKSILKMDGAYYLWED